jgi:hypothetical protein
LTLAAENKITKKENCLHPHSTSLSQLAANVSRKIQQQQQHHHDGERKLILMHTQADNSTSTSNNNKHGP